MSLNERLHHENDHILFIKTLTGTVFEISFDENDSISQIKDKIHVISGIIQGQMRLIYAGKRLEDGRSNNDYGIIGGSTLHMVLRLLAGGIDNNNNKSIENLEIDNKEMNPFNNGYDFNIQLYNDLMSLTMSDFIDNTSTSNLCIFHSNSKVKIIFENLIKEAVKCAEILHLSLGEISLDYLNINKVIYHIANECILPIIKKHLKLTKENYNVDGTLFYEGNENLQFSEAASEVCNKGFPKHIDDSVFTINFCLGGAFSDSKIHFATGEEYEHCSGNGIAHSGDLEHCASPCEGGRYNMLIFLN